MSAITPATTLDTCGCCEIDVEVSAHDNRPGQSAIRYRIGVHSDFLRRMLTSLSRQEIADGPHAGQRPLANLSTRATEDPAIALIDAGAVLYDVLTFYQERIANEGYLRTATERRSILELARAIGYELAPGVAASTYLVFSVDDSDSTPDTAPVPAGTQVQSIPAAQGELPQTFETTEAFEARVEWNALRPRLSEPPSLTLDTRELYVEGANTNLAPGDLLLLVETSSDGTVANTSPRRIRDVKPDAINNRILVQLESDAVSGGGTGGEIQVFALREKVGIFGHNALHFGMLPAGDGVNRETIYHHWDDPDWEIWKNSVKVESDDGVDDGADDGADDIKYYENVDIYLERVISGIVEGSWVILEQSQAPWLVYLVQSTVEDSLAGFAISAKSTGLELTDVQGNPLEDIEADKPDDYKVRKTTAYVKSEALQLADVPITTDIVQGAFQLSLGQQVAGLSAGQAVALTGEDPDGQEQSEILRLETSTDSDGLTTLRFTSGLEHSYVRDTVTINANVVHATHGETVEEVLGSGDGAQANQQFKLRQAPLTYVSAATARGAESTLKLRVNQVLWEEISSLHGLGASDPHYIVRINDDSEATVIFGDGKSGARLPTGQENITATYRAGLGREGEVGADSLTLLKTRPFGIRSVTNPLDASGAADPEKRDTARSNAPLTVLTLDRIVSLRDFEDFAQAFAGIGKAQAINLWNGETTLVHLTIADDDGDAVPDTSDLYKNLSAAIDAARDPSVDVRIDSYTRLTFNLEASVLYDARFIAEDVQAEVEAALLIAFSFDQRAFGQPVTAAEIISVMHQVTGVIAVDLDALYMVQANGRPFIAIGAISLLPIFSLLPAQTSAKAKLASVLPARTARREGTKLLPAELLLINESGIALTLRDA